MLCAAFVSGSVAGWTPSPDTPAPPEEPAPEEPCCKTCRKGKACGDTCIARDKDCTEPEGCACDAVPEEP